MLQEFGREVIALNSRAGTSNIRDGQRHNTAKGLVVNRALGLAGLGGLAHTAFAVAAIAQLTFGLEDLFRY